MKHFVYLLVSFHKKRIISYVGYTNDLKKRLKLHNASKGAKFTRGRGPWVLIYSSDPLPISEALRLESKLKRDRKFKLALKNNSNSNH